MLFESIKSISNCNNSKCVLSSALSSTHYDQSNNICALTRGPLPLNLTPNTLESVYQTLLPKSNQLIPTPKLL